MMSSMYPETTPPPHEPLQIEPGPQIDPALETEERASPVKIAAYALAGVAVVTLVLYGMSASTNAPTTMASNSPPAQAQDPAAASGNTAANNATDKSKPAQGQAKQQENTASAQADKSNKPPTQDAKPQTTTGGQAPSTEKQGASPVRPNG